MTELAVLVPVLRRPDSVERLLDSIAAATADYRVVFVVDPDDGPELAAVRKTDADWFRLDGNYAAKINAAVRKTEEPFLLFAADDLAFRPGWYEAAREAGGESKGGAAGVVATNDLCNPRNQRGELATHPLVARWYAEAPTIDGTRGPLHEGYVHEYVDREFSEVARRRRTFAFARSSIVEHLHPLCGKAPTDPIYDEIRYRMAHGRRLYNRRRRLWS